MTNGATQRPSNGSRVGTMTSRCRVSRGAGSASRSAESANGSSAMARCCRSARTSSICPRNESIVPPDTPPRMPITTSTVSVSVPAPSSCARSCRASTERSDGIESNPAECTMRAPVRRAVSWARSTDARANSTSPVRSAYDVPASAHARTNGSPYFAYGPTVLITARVDSANARSAASSSASATINGQSRCSSDRTASSLSRLRPDSAIRTSAGACSARWRAVRAPTKPVAPWTTRSY